MSTFIDDCQQAKATGAVGGGAMGGGMPAASSYATAAAVGGALSGSNAESTTAEVGLSSDERAPAAEEEVNLDGLFDDDDDDEGGDPVFREAQIPF